MKSSASLRETNNITRTERIIVGTVLPPFLGALLFCLILSIELRELMDASGLFAFIAGGYIVMLLPSFGYSVLMELIAKDWITKTYIYFLISACLGWCASLLPTILVSVNRFDWSGFIQFSLIGILVGFSTGYKLWKMSTPGKNTKYNRFSKLRRLQK